jgi:hypothetical protein
MEQLSPPTGCMNEFGACAGCMNELAPAQGDAWIERHLLGTGRWTGPSEPRLAAILRRDVPPSCLSIQSSPSDFLRLFMQPRGRRIRALPAGATSTDADSNLIPSRAAIERSEPPGD